MRELRTVRRETVRGIPNKILKSGQDESECRVMSEFDLNLVFLSDN